MTRHSKVGF